MKAELTAFGPYGCYTTVLLHTDIEMSRTWDSARLLNEGLAPKAIANRLGISVTSVLSYLNRAVGEGLIRRSDIYFAFPSADRQSGIARQYGTAGVALGDLYDDLRRIEVGLHCMIRDFLIRQFGNDDAGWWRQGVPESVRVKCQERRERDADDPCEPYCYTDLLDLAKIVEAQWSLFRDSFQGTYASNRKALVADLSRLNRIRNKVMHPVRGVCPSEDDFDFVHSLGRDLGFLSPNTQTD